MGELRAIRDTGPALPAPLPLTPTELLLVETRVANDGPSTALAYVLWFFLGALAAHRFYLGRGGSAVLLILTFLVGVAFAAVHPALGVLLMLGVALVLLVDLFTIPGMARAKREKLRQDAIAAMRGGV